MKWTIEDKGWGERRKKKQTWRIRSENEQKNLWYKNHDALRKRWFVLSINKTRTIYIFEPEKGHCRRQPTNVLGVEIVDNEEKRRAELTYTMCIYHENTHEKGGSSEKLLTSRITRNFLHAKSARLSRNYPFHIAECLCVCMCMFERVREASLPLKHRRHDALCWLTKSKIFHRRNFSIPSVGCVYTRTCSTHFSLNSSRGCKVGLFFRL